MEYLLLASTQASAITGSSPNINIQRPQVKSQLEFQHQSFPGMIKFIIELVVEGVTCQTCCIRLEKTATKKLSEVQSVLFSTLLKDILLIFKNLLRSPRQGVTFL